ncbi:MAG: hypothetical protein ACIAXF_02935 [Phycisphaerales bacterium JB063]
MTTPRSPRRLFTAAGITCALVASTALLTTRPTPSRADDDIPTNDAGQRHGRVTLEHPNSETHVQATYREGLLHGTYREFNDAGQLILQATFREGQLHGRLERRTDQGQRLEISRYQEGQRAGTRQVFRDGALVLTETYEDGQRTAQEGDASADPGPPTFGIGTDGFAGGTPGGTPPGDDTAPPNRPAPDVDRPEHQRDTSVRPNGYPYSIDEITRAFGRIDQLRIEGDPDEQQAAAIRRLIKYRLISGLADPIIAFDHSEAILAQRSSEVCDAIGRIDHHPPNPGMPEDEYEQAAEGARRSNLVGRSSIDPATAMEIWMVDYGSSNADEVGHRRWCLAPGLYETAYANHEGFHSLLVGGNTRDRGEYDMLAFPGVGYQPFEYYDFINRITGENLIWTLHLNPLNYTTPESPDQMRITVSQLLPDGTRTDIPVRRIHFAKMSIPLNAILFDPEIRTLETGTVYEVNVQGLERRRRPFTLTYRVEFFELGGTE